MTFNIAQLIVGVAVTGDVSWIIQAGVLMDPRLYPAGVRDAWAVIMLAVMGDVDSNLRATAAAVTGHWWVATDNIPLQSKSSRLFAVLERTLPVNFHAILTHRRCVYHVTPLRSSTSLSKLRRQTSNSCALPQYTITTFGTCSDALLQNTAQTFESEYSRSSSFLVHNPVRFTGWPAVQESSLFIT